MRICLINPPRVHPKSWGKPQVFQPLRIAYVAALLERQHEVSIIDAPILGRDNLELIDGTKYRQGLNNKDIEHRIRRWSPDIVGISIPFSGWSKTAFEVASITKSVNENIFTVLFGQHPSARPLDCLANLKVDFAVIGEPEYTFFELANKLDCGIVKDLKEVRGIAFVRNGETMITSPRPWIQDLDSLPFPARHLLPMKEYFAAVKESPLRGVIHKPWAEMITSRGCPHRCIFCSSHIVNGKQWRSRSPKNVVDEVEQLVNTYNVRQIDFSDDNMTFNRKRMEDICDLIIERGLDIEWYAPNGVRADTLDEKLLIRMRESGCQKIRIAPESGVQHVVNQIIKKNLDLKAVERAVVLSKKVGIKVGCFFVIGLIGEKKEDMKETINFAYKLRKMGAESFIFSIAAPLYGTELYEQAKSGGFLREGFSDESLAAAEPLIETPDFTSDDLREICREANLVNPTFTRDKLSGAIRDPKKIIKFFLEKMR